MVYLQPFTNIRTQISFNKVQTTSFNVKWRSTHLPLLFLLAHAPSYKSTFCLQNLRNVFSSGWRCLTNTDGRPNRWSWVTMCEQLWCPCIWQDSYYLEKCVMGCICLNLQRLSFLFYLSLSLGELSWCSSHSDFNTLWSLRTNPIYVIMAYLITLNWNYLK